MRQFHADHLSLELRVAFDLLARNQTRFEDRLIVINVGEEFVDGGHTLGEAFLKIRPLIGGDNAWNHVRRNQPLGATLIPIHGERNADAAEQ